MDLKHNLITQIKVWGVPMINLKSPREYRCVEEGSGGLRMTHCPLKTPTQDFVDRG